MTAAAAPELDVPASYPPSRADLSRAERVHTLRLEHSDPDVRASAAVLLAGLAKDPDGCAAILDRALGAQPEHESLLHHRRLLESTGAMDPWVRSFAVSLSRDRKIMSEAFDPAGSSAPSVLAPAPRRERAGVGLG